jgi:hypothetical protein
MAEITANDFARMTEADRERVRDWVREHGPDLDNTYSLRTVGPLVMARVYVLNEAGQKQIHPRGDRPWMRTRWLRARRPLPIATRETQHG